MSALAELFSPRPSSYDPNVDIPDLTGKVMIVTGGNSGIGFTTIQQLVRHGARVYMGARNETRAKNAIARLEKEGLGCGSVVWLKMDLSTPSDALAAAKEFLSREQRLDVLVNNAAVMSDYYGTVTDGGVNISVSMSTNHLGPFVFTNALIPVLKGTARDPDSDVRIVFVSSVSHRHLKCKPDFSSLKGWNVTGDSMGPRLHRYGMSKLANVLTAKELQDRLNATEEKAPITCIAVHPGIVYTEGTVNIIYKLHAYLGFITVWLIKLFGLAPKEGAYCSLFASTSPRVQHDRERYKGAYIEPFDRLAVPSEYAQDVQMRKELWKCSEELTDACLGPKARKEWDWSR